MFLLTTSKQNAASKTVKTLQSTQSYTIPDDDQKYGRKRLSRRCRAIR